MTTASKQRKAPAATRPRELVGEALLEDMRAYRAKVTASPEAARDFLQRLGVLTADGKTRTLIRD